ncbi:plasmid pRiA4b ORF-3 family protein [Pleionea mediterranea]|uniref:PRiA4b ORF-3-like protein n=1 Tax=Pleionea mediterranea TaxID=523701 RepID=A0A316G0U9_9GAMM|nr:plasmid pRiA4b ORF-3 family protein [Pleionea mediterranea]PWK53975.1 pRiA4b ORF-3-like protein [Pleionea mediterranea]
MATDLRKRYQITVTLNDVKPLIWRRVLIPSSVQLDALHATLQLALGWTNSHLHQFLISGKRYGIPDPDFDDGVIEESGIRIEQLLKKEKQSLIYEYDFGDGWEHKIELEAILPFEASDQLPICIDGSRSCPPEDVGGPWGYMDFLTRFKDTSHPEHEETIEWVGEYFHPESFDIDEVNGLLAEYVQPRV